MNIQSRKLKAIDFIVRLKDESLLNKIESMIKSQRKQNLKPLSQDELIERAKESTADYHAGRYKTQEQLEEEAKNW